MKLTIINLFKKTVNGHIFRGKERLVKPVSKNAIDKLTRDFQIQENNMLLLRHPYLTIEESSGHAVALEKRQKILQKWRESKLVMKPHVTLESRLNHLKTQEAWD